MKKCLVFDTKSDICVICKLQTEEEQGWIQCDLCDRWLHVTCIPDDHVFDKNALSQENEDFYCHLCVN